MIEDRSVAQSTRAVLHPAAETGDDMAVHQQPRDLHLDPIAPPVPETLILEGGPDLAIAELGAPVDVPDDAVRRGHLRRSSAPEAQRQGGAHGQAAVGHSRVNEDASNAGAFMDLLVDPDVGEQPPGEGDISVALLR